MHIKHSTIIINVLYIMCENTKKNKLYSTFIFVYKQYFPIVWYKKTNKKNEEKHINIFSMDKLIQLV